MEQKMRQGSRAKRVSLNSMFDDNFLDTLREAGWRNSPLNNPRNPRRDVWHKKR